jgi:hypothetical protein
MPPQRPERADFNRAQRFSVNEDTGVFKPILTSCLGVANSGRRSEQAPFQAAVRIESIKTAA